MSDMILELVALKRSFTQGDVTIDVLREVDDAQPGMAEADTGLDVESGAVRAAVPDGRHHALQHGPVRRRFRRVQVYSRESAHSLSCPADKHRMAPQRRP